MGEISKLILSRYKIYSFYVNIVLKLCLSEKNELVFMKVAMNAPAYHLHSVIHDNGY